MSRLPDSDTVLALLRRASDKVRRSTARAEAAEGRERRIANAVRDLVARVERALRAAADRESAALRAASEAEARRGAAEALLASERERVRRLEMRLAEAEARIARARDVLDGEVPGSSGEGRAGNAAALH
ncbi:hypothetical protein [Methylobacterium sp. JK268]